MALPARSLARLRSWSIRGHSNDHLLVFLPARSGALPSHLGQVADNHGCGAVTQCFC